MPNLTLPLQPNNNLKNKFYLKTHSFPGIFFLILQVFKLFYKALWVVFGKC